LPCASTPAAKLADGERILLPIIGSAGGFLMPETLGQVTYAILSSSLGASEFVLGLMVAAGFMVSGVKSLVSRGESDWEERRP
jgi:hypothetical protein